MPTEEEIGALKTKVREAREYVLKFRVPRDLSDTELQAALEQTRSYISAWTELFRGDGEREQAMVMLRSQLAQLKEEEAQRALSETRRDAAEAHALAVKNFELDRRTLRWAIIAGVAGVGGLVVAIASLLLQWLR